MKKRIKRKHINNSYKRLTTEIVLRAVLSNYSYMYDHIEKFPKEVPFRYSNYLRAWHLNKRHTNLGSSRNKKENEYDSD